MAYVGTISFHDADGELLGSRCYTAPAHENPQDRLVVPLMADLRHALRQDATVAVGIIQDGAPELWSLLRAGVAAEPQVTTCYEAIDRYHLNEHLGEVLRVLEPDAETRKTRLSQWNESLDRNDKAIYRIRMEIRTALHCTAYIEAMVVQDKTVQEALNPHVTYLDNNASLMRYAKLRAVGLPMGSGVTEAACKSVIELRTNGRSQRWRPAGLELRVPAGLPLTSVPVRLSANGHQASAQFTVVAAQVSYYHADALGSVRLVTDAGGQPVTACAYLPFGQDWPSTGDVDECRFELTERAPDTGAPGAGRGSATPGRATTTARADGSRVRTIPPTSIR